MLQVEIHKLSWKEIRDGAPAPTASPELRRRIQQHGFVEPIVVRPKKGSPGHFEVLTNAESVVAAGKLRMQEVPVLVRDDLDDDEAKAAVKSLYETASSNPIGEAEWFAEYLEGDEQNIAKIARLTGNSRTHVSRSLAFLRLHEDVQALLRSGSLTAGHGRSLILVSNKKRQVMLAKKAVKQKWSTRELASRVRKDPKPDVAPPAPSKDPDTMRLERQMTEVLGSPFELDLEKGTVTIRYFNDMDTLQGILSKMGYRSE